MHTEMDSSGSDNDDQEETSSKRRPTVLKGLIFFGGAAGILVILLGCMRYFNSGSSSSQPNDPAFMKRVKSSGYLGLLMWNPHGECFMDYAANCEESFDNFTNSLLLHTNPDYKSLDFATLAYTNDKFKPPRGWAALSHICQNEYMDDIMMLYESSSWLPVPGANRSGCMVQYGGGAAKSPFYVQGFTSASDSAMSVVVVSAHFPHRTSMDAGLLILSQAVDEVKSAAGTEKVITIADTNLGNSLGGRSAHRRRMAVPGPDIMQKCCGVARDEEATVQSSAIAFTCCGYDLSIDGYDRIMATFGQRMESVLPLKETPDWSASNFHIPVLGYLYY
jgi:hypothetical protein